MSTVTVMESKKRVLTRAQALLDSDVPALLLKTIKELENEKKNLQ